MEKEFWNMLELKDVRFSVTDEKGQLKNIINGINLKIDDGKSR